MNWYQVCKFSNSDEDHIAWHNSFDDKAKKDLKTWYDNVADTHKQGLQRWYDDNNLILKNPNNEASLGFFDFVDNLPFVETQSWKGVSSWQVDLNNMVYNQPLKYVSASKSSAVATRFAKPYLLHFESIKAKDISRYIDAIVTGGFILGDSQQEILIPQGSYIIKSKKVLSNSIVLLEI